MNRIMILGVSAGVGKSTFARELGKMLEISVYHLDAFFFKPGWIEAPFEEFTVAQQKIVLSEQWIIEGNYLKTYDIREQQADTIIYLELPLIVCLYRFFKRFIHNMGKVRPDMAPGCKEKVDFDFIKFICTTYYSRKKEMRVKLEAASATKNVIKLTNKKEIQSYLVNLHL